MALGTLALAIIAIFIPPLPVLLKRGCGGQFLLNILLMLLVWIPAVLHAWWVLAEDGKNAKRRSSSRTGSRSSSSRRSHEKYSAPLPTQGHHHHHQPTYQQQQQQQPHLVHQTPHPVQPYPQQAPPTHAYASGHGYGHGHSAGPGRYYG